MKSLSFFTRLSVVLLSSCMPSKPSHVGEWKGVDSKGKQISLILNEDNSAILINGNEVLGGEALDLKTTKRSMFGTK